MIPSLHIVSSCSDGKRGQVAAPYRLCTHLQSGIEDRFSAWWTAIAAAPAESKVLATDLYVGDHWSVSRELPTLARHEGWDARLWVLSAGYGLVPSEARIAPYAATFQPRHADSVSRLAGAAQIAEQKAWWQLLCSQALEQRELPRSLTSLAQSTPDGIILVVASPAYLLAVQDDLLGAVSALSIHGSLLLVSSETRGLVPELQQRRISSNARLTHIVQGSLLSLHARVARWLIETSGQHRFRMDAMNDMVSAAVRQSPELVRHDRQAATDDEVLQFMQTRIAADRRSSHSRLLREWREAGRACEQSRFRALFRQLKGQTR